MTLIQVTEKNFISNSVTKQPHYLCLKKSNGPTETKPDPLVLNLLTKFNFKHMT